jgi:hypothetical protein
MTARVGEKPSRVWAAAAVGVALLGAGIVWVGSQAKEPVESYGRKVQAVYGWQASPKPVEAVIGGRAYAIPRHYLDILEVELDGASTGFLAVAKLPDLTPRRGDADWREWVRTPGFSAWTRMLVDAVPDDDISRRFAITYQILGKGREASKRISERAGLHHVEPIEFDRRDIYPYYRLEPDDPVGERHFIICRTKPPDRPDHLFSAGCEQFFTLDNLIVKATYAARYVDDWRSIQVKVADLIRSFQKPHSSKD